MQVRPFVLWSIAALSCGMLWGVAPAPPVFQSLYSFAAGASPRFGLSSVNGMLYGTVTDGNGNGPGSVFSATTTGTVSEIYQFKSYLDGSIPEFLTADSGELYGVTLLGGGSKYGCGTFFAVTPGGKQNVRSPFACGLKGYYPQGKLLRYNGMLLGETEGGGAYYHGTIFVAQRGGAKTVLFSFSGSDGAGPEGGLIELNGAFYGTTSYGGEHHEGTVFTILPSGAEKVVFAFNGADGQQPMTRLVAVNGVLYGTTNYGGAHGQGTVFAVTPAGVETVLHSFAGVPDGAIPESALIATDGALFGTTLHGGSDNVGSVFEISDKGVFKLLHSFGTADGAYPAGDLTTVGRTFYGTTISGGVNNGGTIFGITP